MADIDHSLVHQVQRLITAANVHSLNTWIFCYKMSEADSQRQKRYEKLLRDFVKTKNLTLGIRMEAKASLDLEEEIKRGYYL